MSTYLIDNSIWQKAGRSPAIARRLREIATLHVIITCPPQVLEYCHSARHPAEYTELRSEMESFLTAEKHPGSADALDLQQALWNTARMRAAGAFDCLIAAYAVANDAVVLHSDHDFEHLAAASNGRFREEYVDEEPRRPRN